MKAGGVAAAALLAWVLPAVSVAVAAAEDFDDPHYWLQRMSEAMHRLNYDGTFIYEHNGRMQTMRIIHSVGEEGEKERLITLSGPSREIVRDGERVTCIIPDDNSVLVERRKPARPFPFGLPQRIDKLGAYYRFDVVGKDRIADHAVRRISITPKDGNRYGHRLWIAEESGLLLKSELISEQGLVVEQFLFTSIRFSDGPFPSELLKPQTRGKDRISFEQQATESAGKDEPSESQWSVGRLPPGFERDVYRRHYMPSIQAPVEHFVFSDGLASISVFIERRDPKRSGFVGGGKIGAVNVHVRPVDGDYVVTVVGEVPKAAVRSVAESVRRH